MRLSYSTLALLAEDDEEAAEALNKMRFYRTVFSNRGTILAFLIDGEYQVHWFPNFQAMMKNRLEINVQPASIK